MRELQIVLDGSARRDERQAWLTAQFVAIAFHDPRQMPADPASQASRSRVDPEVEREMAAIRDRVKIRADMARARGRNGG